MYQTTIITPNGIKTITKKCIDDILFNPDSHAPILVEACDKTGKSLDREFEYVDEWQHQSLILTYADNTKELWIYIERKNIFIKKLLSMYRQHKNWLCYIGYRINRKLIWKQSSIGI